MRGGTAGEVPGKPGVCKEDVQATSNNPPKNGADVLMLSNSVIFGFKRFNVKINPEDPSELVIEKVTKDTIYLGETIL